MPLDHHALRLGTLVPARVAIEVFGYGLVSYYAVPVVVGVLLVASTTLLGWLLFGRWVGLAGGVLVTLNPFLVESFKYVSSWQLMPDIAAASMFTSGVVLLLLAAERDTGRLRPSVVLLLLAAGAGFGWAYLAREFSAFLFPLIVVIAVAWRVTFTRLGVVAVPMLAALGVEFLSARLVYGDPLARLNVASEHGGTQPAPVSRLDAALVALRALDHGTVGPLLVSLVVALLLAAVAVRRRSFVMLAVWLLLLWVPIALFSGLLDPYERTLRGWLPRYWTLAMPPVLVGGAAAFAWFARWIRERASLASSGHRVVRGMAQLVGAAALVWYAVPATATVVRPSEDEDWRAVAAWLEEHQDDLDAVWSDTRTDAPLGIYQRELVGGQKRWDLPLGRYPHDDRTYPAPPDDEAVALVAAPRWGPPDLPDPGSGWREVMRQGHFVVYVSQLVPGPVG